MTEIRENIKENGNSLEGGHSTKIHTSYALGSFFNDFITTILAMWVFKFYETEVFLPIAYITIVVIIYGLWNMINDPFAGHISDIPVRFTKRWGKRFSWFIITAIPCSLLLFFVFSPPVGNHLIIFFWALAFLCLFDTFYSVMTINWQAIFPDKFRSQKERTKIGAIGILFSLVGLSLGFAVPLFIITTGPPGENVMSYVLMGVVISIICVVTALLMLPGMHETEEMKEREIRLEKEKADRKQYLLKLKFALKQKNFVAYLFAYLAQNVVMSLLLASIPYWAQYVVPSTQNEQLLLLLVFLLASVCSVPLWLLISRKLGNRIGYILGTGFSALFLFFSLFATDFTGIMICMIFIGISMGGPWTLLYPTFSDIIDEVVVKTGERDEGIYYGFRTFFGRLSIVIQAISFGLIHILTNFDPKSSTQTVQAQWGILFGMFAIPALFYFIGFLFMWKIYDLKKEKVQKIKKQLIELNL